MSIRRVGIQTVVATAGAAVFHDPLAGAGGVGNKGSLIPAMTKRVGVSLTVTSFAADSSPQQQSAAAYLREAGIMLGNESGDMMLEQGLTRAQMAAMLTRVVADPEQFERDSTFYHSLL